MILDNKETAMVLAGLRMLQQAMEEGAEYIMPGVMAILDDADVIVSEDTITAIDHLCENKINVAEPEPVPTTAIFKMDYNTFDKLVNEHLPRKKGEYEFVQAQECGNDTDHLYENVNADEPSDYDKEFTLPRLEAGDLDWHAPAILDYLCRKGVIAPGNYLIQVSW